MQPLPKGFERIPGYERYAPPVPGVGPILNIATGPSGIVAERRDGEGVIATYILRSIDGDWELQPSATQGLH